ncbi:hypothetical protein DSCW_08900 [Desulfosarcina widdelii]|uniref:CHAT domain-containing protein n=1 Tax=Desulfosarcina widdelii TaxID=947919 RepID=A0A5K7YZW8_9BACT|nr:hypothetical protein [Desulfosarcina widdelii]BBO73473.1 hypothetical protein DSCW_08900 [Desulfosarcina widdelii]
MGTYMRVFSVESPSALDAFEERNESATLSALCKLLGHHFTATIVRSKVEFETALEYLTSINPDHIPKNQRKWPLCLHFAAHGDEFGLSLGAEDATWKYLAKKISSFIKDNDYPGPVLVVISACGAGQQQITKELINLAARQEFEPPAYLFVTQGDEKGEVHWRDAVVAWSIFYHNIGRAVLERKHEIMTIMDKIRLTGAGTLKYFRWDEQHRKFKQYIPRCDEYEHS